MRRMTIAVVLAIGMALTSGATAGGGPPAEGGTTALTLGKVAVSRALGPAGVADLNGRRTRLLLRAPEDETYYVEMDATVPEKLGADTIRYTMWLDGKQVLAAQGWDKGYTPCYLVGPGEKCRRLVFLQPVALKTGEHDYEIRQLAGSTIERVTFRPALGRVRAKAEIGGESHVFFPSEKPQAKITFSGPSGAKLTGKVALQRLRLADSWGESEWSADIREVQTDLIGERPVALTLPWEGKADVTVNIPSDRYGLVGITAVLEDGDLMWAKYLGAAAIVPEREMTKFCPDGIFISSFYLGRDDKLMGAYKKIGMDWIRIEFGWGGFEPKKGEFDWKRLDPFYQSCREHGMYVMNLASHAPDWAKPQGNFEDIPYKNYKIKLDNCPGRENMGDWENAWKVYFERYKDVNRATNLWNEPWEGGGISGWLSTGEHYRLLLKHLKLARDAADLSIKIVAADSAHNTDWKVFAANMEDHVDVISTHYESPRAGMGFALARFYNKELWETETWMSWQGDAASLRRCLYNLALGAGKVSLWTKEMLFDDASDPTPAAVWTATTRHMLDGLKFKAVMHPERPPFVLLFQGQDRQVAAVVATLADDLADVKGQFRGQFAHESCVMELEDPEGGCRAFDMLANEIMPARRDGKLLLPVDREVRYIESRGPTEQFEERLGRALYRGLRPVEIVVRDLTSLPGTQPELIVTLRNAHPVPLSGAVKVEARGLTLEPAQRALDELPARGEKQYAFRVVSAEPSGNNTYPLKVSVETDRGAATLEEAISVAVIARGTPKVDGDVSEWQALGAVPVFLTKKGPADLTTVKAWFPWQQFVETGPGFAAEMAFAADDQNLYLMARVKDKSDDRIPSILAGKDLNEYQIPPGDYVYRKIGPWPDCKGDGIQLSLGPLSHPWVRRYEVFPPDSSLYRMGSYLSTLYHYVIIPTDGGGAEVLRTRTPDFYYLHPLPMNYKWLSEHCRVDGAQAAIQRLPEGYVYEAAIPWTELKEVPHAPGNRMRMGILVRDRTVDTRIEWAQGKSIASTNTMDFDPSWVVTWSSETEWGFAGK